MSAQKCGAASSAYTVPLGTVGISPGAPELKGSGQPFALGLACGAGKEAFLDGASRKQTRPALCMLEFCQLGWPLSEHGLNHGLPLVRDVFDSPLHLFTLVCFLLIISLL